MNVLDLFSGIGGFSLGLERAGFKTVAFCEIDKKCQLVLKKHWPNVPIFDDVKLLKREDINEQVDVICGGFPCQDISFAGKGAGLKGERSGLWFEFHRIIKEFAPKFIIIENVAALRSRGLEQVLGSLAEIGYDAEWHCIPASAIGAPHQRDRVWILGYPNDNGSYAAQDTQSIRERSNANAQGSNELEQFAGSSDSWATDVMADPKGNENRRLRFLKLLTNSGTNGNGYPSRIELQGNSWWKTEPNVGRVADGVPGRVDRLKQLGNAIVPQIAELIGRELLTKE